MPFGISNPAASGLAGSLWDKYQGILPEWAKQEYNILPDIGGVATDVAPNMGGAMAEALYNTGRDMTSINPSVDIPLALATAGVGGLAAKGLGKADEAAAGMRKMYDGGPGPRGGIPHASPLPNPGARPIMDARGGFDDLGTSMRGDIPQAPRPGSDFAAMDEMGALRDPMGPMQRRNAMSQMDEYDAPRQVGLEPDDAWNRGDGWDVDPYASGQADPAMALPQSQRTYGGSEMPHPWDRGNQKYFRNPDPDPQALGQLYDDLIASGMPEEQVVDAINKLTGTIFF